MSFLRQIVLNPGTQIIRRRSSKKIIFDRRTGRCGRQLMQTIRYEYNMIIRGASWQDHLACCDLLHSDQCRQRRQRAERSHGYLGCNLQSDPDKRLYNHSRCADAGHSNQLDRGRQQGTCLLSCARIYHDKYRYQDSSAKYKGRGDPNSAANLGPVGSP